MKEPKRPLPDAFCELILSDLAAMSGDVLFEVTATWANTGREGKTHSIVKARDAISALHRFWDVESPNDLRDVTIRWLTPVECVVGERPPESPT
jgi:hypothetical protein